MPEMLEGYAVKAHEIKASLPLIEVSGAKIKTYSLSLVDNPLQPSEVEALRSDLIERLEDTTPSLFSGLGFAVISRDFINCNMWGNYEPPRDYPSLPHPLLYVVHGSKNVAHRRLEKQQDITRAGSYCFWEQEILLHEGRALRAFLKSDRSEAELQKFLNSYFEGIVE